MIRKANNNDGEIREIYELIKAASEKNSILPRSEQEIADVIDCFYVAEEDGKIAGCCAIEIYSPKLAEVRSLAVVPEYQGKDLGSHLVKECVAEAAEKGIYEVLAITDKDAFFEKMGFNKTLNGQWAMFMKFR